ncbi:MAG TPA: NAD(P)/FAD-dependent oxidoreductase [Acidimicrobiia bacterium]|nr:NAD(P)/FAD-dependent oxidoreductase [Acidimicrobiia bacterium]
MTEVDVGVLGVGTGGEDLALQLLDSGLEVAGIEPGLVGGECPYWACIPTKMAIRAANLVAEGRRLAGVAGRAEVVPDWSQVARRIREEATGGWDDGPAAARFEERGGILLRGRGRLVGPRRVAVGDETVVARIGVVVATGSRPAIPPIPGLDGVDFWTTREAVSAEALPASLAVIGGGAVGCELGQVFARFGVEVSVVEGRSRLLGNEEPEASHLVATVFEREGIRLHLGVAVDRVERVETGTRLVLGDGSNIEVEKTLVATGRSVSLADLGLETVGLDPTARYLEVDERMRAGEATWALGDVTGKAMFTHMALHQSAVIAADMTGRDPDPIDYEAIPRVTFTDPEVASVGLTEAQARERGLAVAVANKDVPSTFRGWLHDTDQPGLIKLVIEESTGTLLGATVAAPHGGEVLGLLTLAVQERHTVSSLRRLTYAFPTFHGGVGEALGAYARGTGTVIDPAYASAGYLD